MNNQNEIVAYGVTWFEVINVGDKNRTKEQILEDCAKLSELRESLGDLTKDDGRYCPFCNIAADIHRDVKCPKCHGPTFRGEF